MLINDVGLDGALGNILSFSDGLVLLLTFSIFLYYIFSLFKSGVPGELDEREHHSFFQSLWMIALGITGLYLGGELIVNNAVKIATML
ncbi:MAG: hypothetical protein H6765_09750 [Candidatus Peribacteria bacterium]|nr:MAG: hypothetical protein H6765_09750 [Candidatus Peribacteria bacterium]